MRTAKIGPDLRSIIILIIKIIIILHFERVFFCVKRFWPIINVGNNSQEKFTILHVPHIGFLCYSDWDEIML